MNSKSIKKLLISLVSVLMLVGSLGFHYVKAEGELSTDKDVYEVDEPIKVTTNYAASGAWVGLYDKGATSYGTSYVWYNVTGAPQTANLYNPGEYGGTINSLFGPGEYKIVLFGDGGYTNVIAEKNITITEKAPVGNQYLFTDNDVYVLGDPINVTTKYNDDGYVWVALYKASEPVGGSVASLYWYEVTADEQTTNLMDKPGDRAGEFGEGDYKIVLYGGKGSGYYDDVVETKDISVVLPSIPSTLTIDRPVERVYKYGEPIMVTATSPYSTAWVGLYDYNNPDLDTSYYYWFNVKDYNEPVNIFNTTEGPNTNKIVGVDASEGNNYKLIIFTGGYDIDSAAARPEEGSRNIFSFKILKTYDDVNVDWKFNEDYTDVEIGFKALDTGEYVYRDAEIVSVEKVSDPSCESDGVTKYTVKATVTDLVTNNDKTEFNDVVEITKEATGHKYGEPTYEWAEDYSTCTAKRICENDPTHVDTETVETTKVEKENSVTYTAVFTNPAFGTQTKTITSDYKFKVEVSSELTNGEKGAVTGTVYTNFNAELAIDNAKVSTTNVTVDVWMKDVASLGVDGERHYGRTVKTGMAEKEVPLTVVRDLFAGLETATVSAHVDGGTGKVTYTLKNVGLDEETNKFMITGTPDTEVNARTVWHELVNDKTVKTAVETKDDSSLTVKKGSVMYVGTDKLLIECDLVFDNLTDFNSILAAIKADGVVTLYHDQEAVEGVILYLEPGSRLQLGTSSAEALQDTKVVIDVADYDESALSELLVALQQASTPEELIKAGFEGIKAVTKAINGKNTDVTVTFGHQWSEPVWNWVGNETDGYTAATVTFTCPNNEDHTKVIDAVVTSKTTEATYDEEGGTVWTATAEFEGETYTDTKKNVVPKLEYVLTTDMTEYLYGDPIMVTASNKNAGAWVGMYFEGEPYGEGKDGGIPSVFWYYLEDVDGKTPYSGDNQPFDITKGTCDPSRVGAYRPGNFVIRLFKGGEGGTYTVVKEVHITVKQSDQDAKHEMSVEKTEFEFGEPILVTATSTYPDTSWVGLYHKEDTPADDNFVFRYSVKDHNGMRYDILTGTAGSGKYGSGEFKLVLFGDETDDIVLDTIDITIKDSGAVLSTDKTEYAWGEPIMVTADAPEGPYWVGLYLETDDTSANSFYWYYVADYKNVPHNILSETGTHTDGARIEEAFRIGGQFKVMLVRGSDRPYLVMKEAHFSIANPKVVKEEVIKEPTCTEAGLKEVTYETGATQMLPIDPLGHTYGEPVWTWAEDYSKATAEFTCSVCDHKETVEATVTSERVEPTKEADGKITYNAKVTFEEKEYTDVKEVVLTWDDVAKNVLRIAGNNRAWTSIQVAEKLKEESGLKQFDSVIIASGKDFADALSGTYLADLLNAPILLVRDNKKADVADILSYVKENLPAGKTVYILGGPAAVSEDVEAQYSDYTVKRLAGGSRYKTNLAILEEIEKLGGDMSEILISTGLDYADSLSASAAKKPMLMVKGDGALRDDQKAYIGEHDAKYYIIGGPKAVNEDIENELMLYSGNVERVMGGNRYLTAVAVADKFIADPKGVAVSFSEDFPDALCGGVLASKMGYSLMFAKEGREKDAVAYIADHELKDGIVLGGEKALSDAVVRTVFSLTEDDIIEVYGE